MQITHKGNKGIKKIEEKQKDLRIEKERIRAKKRTIKVLKTDSYEIDWATERKLPIREYLELEDQPASKTANTIIEPTQKNITKE